MVTSFFVSEFPDFYSAKNLFDLFGCSGNVVEVAISPRRNKFGKRSGFERFIDVDDGRLLAIRLDNIVIEGKKIHVNLPRFDRNQGGGKGRQGAPGYLRPTTRKFAQGPLRKESISYADAVGKRQVPSSSKVNIALFDFQTDHSVRQRLEKAYVGRVCLPGSAYSLQNYLEMEGIFAIRVTPMGGNCCLLEDLEEGFIEDLIKVGETWWKSWFSIVEKWKAGCVDGNRDVWLRIYGVPLHAWCSEFFVSLGECWGRFICLDENTSKGEIFDVARLMVNIPISVKMPDYASVSIDGVIHNLYIREDVQISYRTNANKQKVHSSDGDSSESEFDRIEVDSDSECSIDSRGLEDNQVPLSDSLVKKIQASPSSSFKGDSGVGNKALLKDRLDGSDEVAKDSNNCLFASSIAGVVSEDIVDKTHDSSYECFEGSDAIPSKGKVGVVSVDCTEFSSENREVVPASNQCDTVMEFCKAGDHGLVSEAELCCDGLAANAVGEGRKSGRLITSRVTRSIQLEQRQCSGNNHITDVEAVETVFGTAGFSANGIASTPGQVSPGSVSYSNSAMPGLVLKQDLVPMARGRGGGKVIKNLL